MKKFGFVVLHYKTYDDTVETIESILALPKDGHETEIVVVDNASGNGSAEKILEKYEDAEKVTIIQNIENMGFSSGNNVGFSYLKGRCCDFIILSNNDIMVMSKDFYEKVERDYDKYGFGVLGPGIYNPDDKRTGCRTIPPTLAFARGRRFRIIAKYFLKWPYALAAKLFSRREDKGSTELPDTVTSKWKNVTIHGCFMIFSPEYINRFDGLMEKTFMYAEEELLFIRLMEEGMVSIYDPEIKVFHKEGVATSLGGKSLSWASVRRHVSAQNALIEELKRSEKAQYVYGEKLEN